MKKNQFVIERHIYAPELNSVRYYRSSKPIPGDWKALSNCKEYADCVRCIRRIMRKGVRDNNTPQHYAILRFADSGNVFAAGTFNRYEELQEVIHRTGRTLTIEFK